MGWGVLREDQTFFGENVGICTKVYFGVQKRRNISKQIYKVTLSSIVPLKRLCQGKLNEEFPYKINDESMIV